ncbi:DUF6303 family protein [Streptomyces sp. NPDC059690]|uniref:DUF6303 family protein n=1 Tax=Streptomyces sp. NPDC059690 TaxID=3346907 RepID=UPI0036D1E51F
MNRYEAILDIVMHHVVPVRWELRVQVLDPEDLLGFHYLHVAGGLERDADIVVNPIPTIYERERLLETVGFVSALDPDYDADDGQGWRWHEESALMGVPEGVIDLRATLPVVPIEGYAERGALRLAAEIQQPM